MYTKVAELNEQIIDEPGFSLSEMKAADNHE